MSSMHRTWPRGHSADWLFLMVPISLGAQGTRATPSMGQSPHDRLPEPCGAGTVNPHRWEGQCPHVFSTMPGALLELSCKSSQQFVDMGITSPRYR